MLQLYYVVIGEMSCVARQAELCCASGSVGAVSTQFEIRVCEDSDRVQTLDIRIHSTPASFRSG